MFVVAVCTFRKRQNLRPAFPKPMIKMMGNIKEKPVEAMLILLKRQLREKRLCKNCKNETNTFISSGNNNETMKCNAVF